MKRSWMTGLAVTALAPLAAGCGSAVHPEESVAGVRTPPPYSVVAAPQAAPQASSRPSLRPIPARSMPAPMMDAVYAPRTQSVPAVVPDPPSALPVVVPPRTGGESTSMRVPTPEVPVTVGSGYQHSDDYTTLVGELHHNPRQNTWRLRYASVGDEDRYGGSVTLDGVGRMMNGFKSGQTVRVQGMLVDAESREISPAFRVRDIHPAN